MKKLLFLSILFPICIFSSIPEVIQTDINFSYHIEKKIPKYGMLKQEQDGFLYIEVSNNFIFDILPTLNDPQILVPPYFENDKIGAHITVATMQEIKKLNYPKINDLGKIIHFTIENISKVKLENSYLGSEIYYLKINSSKIEEIRKNLELPAKINDYDFHITIGIKK
jgi:hypothetical protein